MISQETVLPPPIIPLESSANNGLVRELRDMSARFRSAIQASPTDREIDNLKKAPGIQKAVMDLLVTGFQNGNPLDTWDAIVWVGRLGIQISDKDIQNKLPALAKECEAIMDANGTQFRPKERSILRRRVLQAGGATVVLSIAGGIGKAVAEIANYGRNTTTIPRAVFEPITSPAVTATVDQPTPTAAPTAEPTPEPKEEKIGDLNFAEYLLGGLLDRYKARRLERLNFEPGFRERIHKEFLNTDQMTFLLLGTDELRERADYFSGVGGGRADVIELISFNPHNFKILRLAIPRDMFAPELGDYIRDPKFAPLFEDGGPRITNMTQTARVAGFDSMELVRRIVESALGIPIDQIVKFNIDATQGYQRDGNFHPGFFDAVIPEGLEINVQSPVVSADSGKVVIPAGKQTLNGKMLTEFVRIRPKSGSGDFDRTNRREQVIKATLIHLAKNMLGEYVFKGDVSKLDKLIEFLQTAKNNGDVFDYERDITKDTAVIKDTIVKLMATRQGQAALLALVANTTDEANKLIRNPGHMVSYNFNRNDLVANVQAGEPNTFGNLYLLKPKGSYTNTQPSAGGFLKFWEPFRQKSKELISQII